MRESLMYGSVRGTRGNSRPYRDDYDGHLCCTASGTKLLNARALVCPEELAKADMRPFRRDSAFDPQETLDVQCGNGFAARFEPYQSTRLSRYNAGP
jgi:hypothetical protein